MINGDGNDNDDCNDDDIVSVTAGSKGWRRMDYIWNKSWVLLDRFDPVSDYEVRLLARNRLGDMSTSSILKFSNQRHGEDIHRFCAQTERVRRVTGLPAQTDR